MFLIVVDVDAVINVIVINVVNVVVVVVKVGPVVLSVNIMSATKCKKKKF